MPKIEQTIRGMPLWLVSEYLEELGGQAEGNGVVAGPDWQVELEQLEDFVIGALRVGQVRFVLEAEDDGIEPLWQLIQKKLIRAGG